MEVGKMLTRLDIPMRVSPQLPLIPTLPHIHDLARHQRLGHLIWGLALTPSSHHARVLQSVFMECLQSPTDP